MISKIYADKNKLYFSTYIGIGIQNTRICERLDTKYSSLSKLYWDSPINIFFTFKENIAISNFITNIQFDFLAPNKFGSISDYDYYSLGQVSQYSKHSNHTDNDFSFYFDFGYLLKISNLSIIPSICGKYQFRKNSAWDGYLQVQETGFTWTEEENKQNVVGNVISYEQEIFIPFFSIQTKYKLNEEFSILGTLKYSPYFFANCTDCHHIRNIEFFDKIKGKIYFGFDLYIQYKRFGVILTYEYLNSSSKSKTYSSNVGINDSSKEYNANYIPGISSNIFAIGFYCKF